MWTFFSLFLFKNPLAFQYYLLPIVRYRFLLNLISISNLFLSPFILDTVAINYINNFCDLFTYLVKLTLIVYILKVQNYYLSTIVIRFYYLRILCFNEKKYQFTVVVDYYIKHHITNSMKINAIFLAQKKWLITHRN